MSKCLSLPWLFFISCGNELVRLLKKYLPFTGNSYLSVSLHFSPKQCYIRCLCAVGCSSVSPFIRLLSKWASPDFPLRSPPITLAVLPSGFCILFRVAYYWSEHDVLPYNASADVNTILLLIISLSKTSCLFSNSYGVLRSTLMLAIYKDTHKSFQFFWKIPVWARVVQHLATWTSFPACCWKAALCPSGHVAVLILILQHHCFIDISLSWCSSWNQWKMDLRRTGHFLTDQAAGSSPPLATQAM